MLLASPDATFVQDMLRVRIAEERVREPKPKQPTQEPTQASLTTERFVVLVDFQTVCARLEKVPTHSERDKPFGKSKKVDEVNETFGKTNVGAMVNTFDSFGSNSHVE